MKLRLISLTAAVFFAFSGCASTQANDSSPVPKEYLEWLSELKKDMIKRGISKETISAVYTQHFYQPNSDVIKKDRQQPEFTLTSTSYINRLVNAKKVKDGRAKYKQLAKTLKPIEQKYGVPVPYILAFWGLETNYGAGFGNYNTIAALTALSYDKRRPEFFRNELYQALKIIDIWKIDYTKMQGSWAGAMGHFQFMPSTFNAYAVDFNQDGQIDIWHDFEDASASAANYLSSIGWNRSIPWGTEVSLPWNFNFSQTGRLNKKTVAEWKKQGVKLKNNAELPFENEERAAIIMPEGKKGRSYLVLSNFDKIMNWNRSENYALSIGILADYIGSSKEWLPLQDTPSLKLKTDDVTTIQSFVNRLGWFKLDEDGQLGSKTRDAVKMIQKKAQMPQDGYPDNKLLEKIRNYNPEIGFAVPVPERKLHSAN